MRAPVKISAMMTALFLVGSLTFSGRLASPTVAEQADAALPAGLVSLLAGALATDQSADYAVVAVATRDDAFRIVNPAHHLAAAFLPEGVAITTGDATGAMTATWEMHLSATGYGSTRTPVTSAAPTLRGARVEYRRGEVTEWYLNSSLGIEQGFTLAAPPPGGRQSDLVLAVDLTGAVATENERAGVLLTLPDGGQTRYGHLSVVDATGRALPARLAARGNVIEIVADDRGAVYPLVVDPLVQQAKLLAGDAAQLDRFGFSVAMSADGATAVIGAYGKKRFTSNFTGAAYVFIRTGTTWTQQQKLTAAPDDAQGDLFGLSVTVSAMSGDGTTAVIGAPGKQIGADTNAGAAYVFVRSGTTWTQQQKLTAGFDEAQNDRFGNAVAVSGDGTTAVIGAGGKNSSTGAAYVFARSGTTWSEQQKLTAGDAATNDHFGDSVATSGDSGTAVIGAYNKNHFTGAAYVFTRSGTTWTQQQELTAGDAASSVFFGLSVAASGDGTTAVIGAEGNNNFTGAAYIFTRSGVTWTQQQELTASGAAQGDRFGNAVAASTDGTSAVIGAQGNSNFTGATYVFARSGVAWSQQQKLTAGDATTNDNFGRSVAMSGDGTTAVIGADGNSSNTGAAYVFAQIPPPTVTGIAPSSGGTTGGNPVTITGTGFVTGATVKFGNAPATNCTVVNATTITCTTPANNAGIVTVTVTNLDGQMGSLAGAYTYGVVAPLPPPKPPGPNNGVPVPLPVAPQPAGTNLGVPAPLPPRRP